MLVHREIAAPEPKAGEVLIRISHAGINFMDVHTREGKYAKSQTYTVTLPCTLGMEGAGEVVSVGAGVSDFKPGDRVAYCIVWGSYAEYAVVPVWRCSKFLPRCHWKWRRHPCSMDLPHIISRMMSVDLRRE